MTGLANNPDAIDRSRLAVFLSGSGRTLENLHKRITSGRLEAKIVDVVASRPCRGVERAFALGYQPEIIPASFTPKSLEKRAQERAIGLIVLAGYLRKMPVPAAFRDRIVNIHPGLLPGDGTGGPYGGKGMFGERVHRAVLEAGDAESGCTVHYCDDAYDAGPILIRRTCPVLPGDTPDSLAARVFELELEAYPDALQLAIGRPGTLA